MISKKHKGMIRYNVLAIEDVLPYVSLSINEPIYIIRKGFKLRSTSVRLATFKVCGLKCAHCGIHGNFFAIETNNKNTPSHINLYAIDDVGEEVLMTCDHIIPKSKGGLDELSNCQTMCKPCNEKKRDTIKEIDNG